MFLLEYEALVALDNDLGEAPEIVRAARIHAELTVLTRDVGSYVPRVGEGVERLVGDPGDLAVPALRGVGGRFDGARTVLTRRPLRTFRCVELRRVV